MSKQITESYRIQSIDYLRGLVMLIMTLDHVREFFFMAQPLPDPMQLDGLPPEVFFSRWLTHICAPVFVLLTGVSAYLYGQKAGRSKADVSRYLFKRGLLLILLEATLINFAWTFSFPPSMLYFQVIWAIGFSMISLSGLLWLPVPILLSIGLVIVFGHNLLQGIEADTNTAVGIVWAFLYDRKVLTITESISLRTSYPALPWVGVIALGYAAGRLYQKSFDPNIRANIFYGLGMLSILAFIVLRFSNMYGEANLYDDSTGGMLAAMSFFNVTKYPPSLQFLLMTLGPALIILALSEKWQGWWFNFTIIFGKVPFFYYVLHLYVLHLAYRTTAMANDYNWHGKPLNEALPAKYSLDSIFTVWGLAMVTIVIMYPAMRYLVRLKGKNSHPVLSYL